MTLAELAESYLAALPGLVLDEAQTTAMAVAAARFYAGYGDIISVSQSDVLLSAPGAGEAYPVAPDPAPAQRADLPIRNLGLITGTTDISTGEWAIIRPLFVLYCERGNATLIEATRGLGVDVFGRTVSEVAQAIESMENEILPSKCFATTVQTIGADGSAQPVPGSWSYYYPWVI